MVCSNGSSGKEGGGGGKVKSWYKRSIVVSSGSNSVHASVVVVLVLRTTLLLMLPFDSSSFRDSNKVPMVSIPSRQRSSSVNNCFSYVVKKKRKNRIDLFPPSQPHTTHHTTHHMKEQVSDDWRIKQTKLTTP